MNYLIPPDLLASKGIVFSTREETSAFSDHLSKELLKRLAARNQCVEIENYKSFRYLYENNPEWKAEFFTVLEEILEEVTLNLPKIRGYIHMRTEEVEDISIYQLYFSQQCQMKLLSQGINTIGDLFNACKTKTLYVSRDDLEEIIERGRWLIPFTFN